MSWRFLRMAAVTLLVGAAYCAATDVAYDFSGYFVGGRYNFEATAAPGDAIEWLVVDGSGEEVFRSASTADSEGRAESEYWKASETGEYNLVRYVNGEETTRESLMVRSPYVLENTYHEDFGGQVEWCASAWNQGGYIKASTSKALIWWATCPIAAEVFVLEVKVSFARHTAGGAGLAFGISEDRRSWYAVGIDPQGYCLMAKMSPNGLKYIGERTACQFIRQGLNTANTVRVEVKAGVAYVSFNGHPFITLRDHAIPRGQVGLALMNVQGGVTAIFDDFALSLPAGEDVQPGTEADDEGNDAEETPRGKP